MRPPRAPELSTAADLLVDHFELVASGRSEDVLRLAVLVPCALAADARPTLVVVRETPEGGSIERAFPPRAGSMAMSRPLDSEPLTWLATFALPVQIARDPSAEFALWLHGDLALSLPVPIGAGEEAEPARPRRSVRPAWPYGVRRSALAVLVTCQLCVLPGWAASGAMADGSVPTAAGAPAGKIPGAEGQPGSEAPPQAPPGEESPPSEPPPSEPPPSETPPAEPPSDPPPSEQPGGGQNPPEKTPGPKGEPQSGSPKPPAPATGTSPTAGSSATTHSADSPQPEIGRAHV